jgi:subtilisin family serine protease
MTKTKIGIALFGCLILGAVMLANSPLEAKNSDNKDNSEQAYIQDEIISQPEYVQDEILVKYKGDDKPFRVVKVPKGKVGEKVKEYKGRKDVVLAEPNYILYAFDGPADPLYADWQWALNNTGQYQTGYFDEGTPGADINWEPAWSEFATSTWAIDNTTTTIIAILDSGIDARHPDLKNKLVPGRNFTDYGGPNGTKDFHGHGTRVSGIAGAETNNTSAGTTGGIAGVAFADNIKIMPVKVLGDNACSDVGSVADGIIWAADPEGGNAKVINLSLGGESTSYILESIVDDAWNNGVLVVAAAGNDGDERFRYPASFSNVMSAAATDNKDKRASFSNYNDEIDISAPGVRVHSTLIYRKGIREYGLGDGTSFACPHVAGLAGLLFAQDSSRTNVQVREIIEKSADDLGVAGKDNYFGHGRINVYAALTYSTCILDGDCESGKICCLGKCIAPACTGDGDCDDGESCTAEDICKNPGTCEAYCENTWPACSMTSDNCCGPECTSANDPDCSPSECITNGKRCNCDGYCDKSENFKSCPWDCQQN